ncbi:hypothetical protein A7X57_02350 [Stenotrophomonas maltophilia]|nr:hypothetical protein A7X57_02350 [Stenotrophomonas maltophilia]
MRSQQKAILAIDALAVRAICPWLDVARAEKSQILNAGETATLFNADQAFAEQALLRPHFGFASCAGRADVIDSSFDLSLVCLARREAQ